MPENDQWSVTTLNRVENQFVGDMRLGSVGEQVRFIAKLKDNDIEVELVNVNEEKQPDLSKRLKEFISAEISKSVRG